LLGMLTGTDRASRKKTISSHKCAGAQLLETLISLVLQLAFFEAFYLSSIIYCCPK
jgi:hypothetical protein